MKAASQHFESLDAFRGLTVAGMILVNNPGSWDHAFPQLVHAGWDGWTFADLIFPFFLFILGAAISFAFARRTAHGRDGRPLYARIARRAASLVALGLVLNVVAALPGGPVRIPGVLQRIGIVYAIAAVVVLRASTLARVAIVAALTIGHWLLVTRVPFGGSAAGVAAATDNLPGFVDLYVFGTHTLTASGDPEGIVGTITAVATALLGTLAGDWLRRAGSDEARAIGLVGAGALLVAAGSWWSLSFPLNKPMWTGSYVLVTAGLAAVTLAVCHVAIDMAGIKSWATPFRWLGLNALAVYFLSEVVGHLIDDRWSAMGSSGSVKSWLFWTVMEPRLAGVIGDAWTSFAFAAAFVALWLVVAAVMFKRGVRLQV